MDQWGQKMSEEVKVKVYNRKENPEPPEGYGWELVNSFPIEWQVDWYNGKKQGKIVTRIQYVFKREEQPQDSDPDPDWLKKET